METLHNIYLMINDEILYLLDEKSSKSKQKIIIFLIIDSLFTEPY